MAERGILRPDERVELIRGVVRRMSPKNRAHVVAATRLYQLGQDDVPGLEVPVGDPVKVRGRERLGDLDGVAKRLFERKSSLSRDARCERFALDVLHHEEVGALVAVELLEDRHRSSLPTASGWAFRGREAQESPSGRRHRARSLRCPYVSGSKLGP